MVVEVQHAAALHQAHLVGKKIIRVHYRYPPTSKDKRLGYQVLLLENGEKLNC
jgi:hypothetical protein